MISARTPAHQVNHIGGRRAQTRGGHRIQASCEARADMAEHSDNEGVGAGGSEGGGDEIDKADELDVSSSNFNPSAALSSPDVRLPYPNVRCFQNIAAFVSFTKGRGRGRGRGDPKASDQPPPKAKSSRLRGGRRIHPPADPERIERLKKLMVNNATKKDGGDDEGSGAAESRQAPEKKPRNLLTWMSKLEQGPFGGLYRCVKNRLPISVHVRTFRGLRGVCKGYLLAFDKFWNMALADVDEVYRKPLLGQAFHSEPRLTVNELFKNLSLQSEAREPAVAGQDRDPGRPKSKQQRPDDPDCGSTSSDARCGYATDSAVGRPGRCTLKSGALTSCRSDAADLESKRSRSLDGARRYREGTEESGAAVLSSKSDETKRRPKKPGRREEMDRVYRRHINHLFIRGDSVILVVVHGT